ncbi:MAG TPA: hypothetical protein VL738_15650 [Dactylosporangium sp.]|nr:hypothetical protein [Dactylosporangium sp.]
MLAVIGVAILALAGCNKSADNGAEPGKSSTPTGVAADARAAWLKYSQCVRANGYPDYPDPQENEHGDWVIPASAPQVDVQACATLFLQAKQLTGQAQLPSAEEMAKRRQFAACVRQHGVPTFPDPNEEGSFELSEQDRANPKLNEAREACKQFAVPQKPK